MSIENIYFIAQIIAAVAILGTLAYGILQLRINNRLSRIELSTTMAVSIHEFSREIGKDAHASRVWRLGVDGSEELTHDERVQFSQLCTAAFQGFELQHILYTQKMFDEELSERGQRQILFFMTRAGVRNWWPKNRLNFSKSFYTNVDNIRDAALEEEAASKTAPTD